MATKSDFAQKLLNDLKLRKQRLASSSQTNSTRPSHSTARDAYSNTGKTYGGSRQSKPLASASQLQVDSKQMNQRTRSARSSRPPDIKESPQQIVSYGTNGNSSDYVGDLSMAFAYALQNGKLDFSSKNSSMIDFLHQIGRRSLDMGKIDQRTQSFNNHRSSTTHFPTVSQIHIKEISKGVQNLNQILRLCSNGTNFDKYSIEVGKELLKGAKGLEESLRMLVNLQEASEYMVNPQKKNQTRLTLLEEYEEDENSDEIKTAQQRQVDLPRFSFDKRSRNSHGRKEAANQKILALTYSTDSPNLMPHKRSASYDTDIRSLSTLTDTKGPTSSVQSKSEKGKLSNVIAKLMGLEEIQEKNELQSTRKAPSSKQREGLDTNTKKSEASKREIEQEISIRRNRETAVLLKAEKTEALLKVNDRSNRVPDNGRNGRENERKNTKHKEQKSTEESLNIEVKQNQKNVFVTDTLQDKIDGGKITIQTEKINVTRAIPRNYQQPQKNHGQLQQHMFLKSEQHNRKQASKQELRARKLDKSLLKSKVSSKPAASIQKKQSIKNQMIHGKRNISTVIDERPLEVLPNDKENEEFSRDESSIRNLRDGSSNKNESLKELELKQEMKHPWSEQPLKPEKEVHGPPTRKKEDSMFKREVPRKIDKVVSIKNEALDKLARSSKHQHPLIQELKQRSQERMSSLERAEQVKSKLSNGPDGEIESEPNIQSTDEANTVHQEDERVISTRITDRVECQNVQKTAFQVLSVSNGQTGQAPDCIEDIKLQDNLKTPLAGVKEGKVEAFHVSKQMRKKVQVVLTENEKHLKEILVKAHSFLHIAEALFKLNIPVGNLYAEDHNHQDWETKLKLDCGNELMRRKARSQELVFHPYVKVSIGYTKISSLDELIKQLYKDFENLTFNGRNEDDEVDTADYLQKMVERDIQSKDQDINSFWDFGWNEAVFGFVEKEEVTRDLEKSLLNGLIDEIIDDFLSMSLLC